MTDSFAYDLAMALIPGTVGGYYAGLLMAKHSKFSSLIHESLRAIRSVTYMGDNYRIESLQADRVEELQLIASELLGLKHRRAGEQLLQIAKEFRLLVASCEMSAVSPEAFDRKVTEWQERVRGLTPGLRFLLPWGQI